jgi:eukaryotic-like serine/threonine-protein kinase
MTQPERLEVIDGEGEQPAAGGDDPLVGQTIDGRYQVERVLGEGGMGLVYKARHTVLGKPLALKVLRPDVSKDDEIITRFRQEAQSASSIGNEHIIDISDFGTLADGSTYFVMEFLDGTDLTGAIESETPMRAPRVVHIAKQMCRALAAAHDIGIVHRDLKPDNIFLIKRGG